MVQMNRFQPEISVIVPTLNEEKNIVQLLERIKDNLVDAGISYEVIVVDGHSVDRTVSFAKNSGARVILQNGGGFGNALREGFAAARGKYILTLDADFSHNPETIKSFLEVRNDADIILGSRYVEGGEFIISLWRRILSKFTNVIFSRLLHIPVKDLSGNFRLYRHAVLKAIHLDGINYDILQEIMARAWSEGFSCREIPIKYEYRSAGESKLKVSRFIGTYLYTLFRLWKLRNSVKSADYDFLAYDSWIPLQRFWQRRRCRLLRGEAEGGVHVLDVGCGSSRLLKQLPSLFGIDIRFPKIRFAKKFNKNCSCGSINQLPFKSASFDVVICSQVIEHIPKTKDVFDELDRVLIKGGKLIVGTPDYDKKTWCFIEKIYDFLLPDAYAQEHQSHYTRDELVRLLVERGYVIEKYHYVFNSELIVVARK